MKQHMLTHKIRDMFGNSESGDESRMSSGGHTSDSQQHSSTATSGSQHINFAIKLEKSQSPDYNKARDGEAKLDSHAAAALPHGLAENGNFATLNGQYNMKPDNGIKQWCNKLNEMPENIAAS